MINSNDKPFRNCIEIENKFESNFSSNCLFANNLNDLVIDFELKDSLRDKRTLETSVSSTIQAGDPSLLNINNVSKQRLFKCDQHSSASVLGKDIQRELLEQEKDNDRHLYHLKSTMSSSSALYNDLSTLNINNKSATHVGTLNSKNYVETAMKCLNEISAMHDSEHEATPRTTPLTSTKKFNTVDVIVPSGLSGKFLIKNKKKTRAFHVI